LGNLRLLGIAVHRGEIAGKPRKLVVHNLFATHLARLLNDVFEDRDIQAG
jgi:hypothetical protein